MEVVGCLFLLVGLWSLWLNGQPDRYAWWSLAVVALLAEPLRGVAQPWAAALLLAAAVVGAGAWVLGALGRAWRTDHVAYLLAAGLLAGLVAWPTGLGPPRWVPALVALLGAAGAVAGGMATRLSGVVVLGLAAHIPADLLGLAAALRPGALLGESVAVGNVAALLVLTVALLRDELAVRRGIVEQLSRSQEHFRMVFEHSGVAMALLTPQGGFVRVNPALVQLFGYQVEELQGRHLLDLTGDDSLRASNTEQGLGLPEGVYEREREFRRKDGARVAARVLRVPLRDERGHVRYLVAVVLDVTERKRAEAALAASEARYRLRFEGASDGQFTCTAQGGLLDANPAFLRLTGLSPNQVAGHNLAALVEDAHALHRHLARALEHGGDRVEMRLRGGDGSWRDVEIASSVLQQDGQPVLYAAVRDVTERKRAEEKLRRAEEELRRERDFWTQVVGTSAALILVLDRQGRLVRSNDAARALLWPDREPPPEGASLEAAFPLPLATTLRGHLDGLVGGPAIIAFEASLPAGPGGERWIAWRAAPTRDARQPGLVVLTGVDTTEQRRLEEQLRHAQKMECLGTLVGGIAHDFNNQLAIVLGNLELLLQEARRAGTRRELIDAERAARRCADMTQSLLAFSRRRVVQLRRLNPASFLGELVPLLQRVLPATIQVDVEVPASSWLVEADSTQLHQVLMNLAINARDAMPGGGRLRIALGNRVLAADATLPHPSARPGQFVVLTVQDSGCGMTPEVAERVFEPFFTTKEVGKGTGLGLPVVFGIVQSHQGWITLQSEPGRGTTFEIWLPAIVPTPEPEPGAFDVPPVRGGQEMILVVDDEEMLRGLGRAVLERWGYRVQTARDGEEALAVLRQYGDEIRLVLLDLTMPGQTGLQLLPRLRDLVPELRVVFSSGHGDAESLLAAGANAFLPKPYRPDELLRLVRRILDAPPARSNGQPVVS